VLGGAGAHAQTPSSVPPASSNTQTPPPVPDMGAAPAPDATYYVAPPSETMPNAAPSPPVSQASPSQPPSGLTPTGGGQAQPLPLIDLQKDPPLPPPVPRTDRTHDGFYARVSLGFGNLCTTLNSPNSGAITGDGSTLALDVALGYAVSPGIVLGATLLMESLPSIELSAMDPTTTDVNAQMLGPFFDGYPSPRGGFHLGGGVGAARTGIQRREAAGFTHATGYGISGWLGYDVWVADQWSAGILVRLMGTRTKADAEATEYNNDAGSASMATQSIALMLTGLYN